MILTVTYENRESRPYVVRNESGSEFFTFRLIQHPQIIDLIVDPFVSSELRAKLFRLDFQPLNNIVYEMFCLGHIFDWSSLPEDKLPQGISQ